MDTENATIRNIAGIETEYGIMLVGNGRSDPFLASDIVLRAYPLVGQAAAPTAESFVPTWRAEDEEAEIIPPSQEGSPALPAEISDLMLGNGARLYIDHAHPEYSTPECVSPRQLVAADKAGEQLLTACMHAAKQASLLPHGCSILIYKNNGDYKNNSYGCHENYLVSRELFHDLVHRRIHRLFRTFLPFLVTRSLLCGAGKVGGENGTAPVGFQLSQRADFFEELIGLQTTQQRPLFNVRDEPHADATRYRRLHVILGDANMAEYSTYLKVGTSQLLLRMLEEEFFSLDLTLRDPLAAFQIVSRDLSFQKKLQLEAGSQMTALEIQRMYLEQARLYLNQRGGSEEEWQVWQTWAEVLEALPDHPEKLSVRLDWAIKLRILNHYLDNREGNWDQVATWQPVIEASEDPQTIKPLAKALGLDWEDYEQQRELYYGLRRLDLEYHDIRQDATQGEVGLFYRLQQHGAIERVVTDAEVARMRVDPPEQTRAWLRGQCIRHFGQKLILADWEYLRFSSRAQELHTTIVRLDDPSLNTATTWEPVWSQFQDSESFLEHCRTLPSMCQEM